MIPTVWLRTTLSLHIGSEPVRSLEVEIIVDETTHVADVIAVPTADGRAPRFERFCSLLQTFGISDSRHITDQPEAIQRLYRAELARREAEGMEPVETVVQREPGRVGP